MSVDPLIAEASLSDLWFAYAAFHHVDTGRDLGSVADDFLDTLANIGVDVPFGWESVAHDQEWLIQEWYRRI